MFYKERDKQKEHIKKVKDNLYGSNKLHKVEEYHQKNIFLKTKGDFENFVSQGPVASAETGSEKEAEATFELQDVK